MANKVSLEDLAKRAGVHRSTVSLALRNHPRISERVRRRIQDLAKELHYRANPLVTALMQSRRTGKPDKHVTIAFVTNYPTRDGWRPSHHERPDFFPGAGARARELGYNLEHFWLAEPGMTPRRFCDILTTRGIDGLILGRLPPGQNSLDLDWSRFSCVALGMTLRSPVLHHVTENHFDTVWQCMRRCIDYGYRRVGFVFSEPNDSPRVGDRWLSAYLGQQLQYPEENRLRPCPQIPVTFESFKSWYARERPDAILATHARHVLCWLEKMGTRVPEDVGIVDIEADWRLECAGVYYDRAAIGSLAVEMLIGLMHRNETGVPIDQHEILLSGHWRDGGSLPRKSG